jgi:Sulfotransferase family
MSAQLDFIAFAPGRSGTTAFAHGFNAHPNVFCALEFFRPKADHSTFSMPEDMLRYHLVERPVRVQSIEVLRQKLSSGEVNCYGNKMPNYYFRLEHLRQNLPNLKLFYIYRSPLEFVHSWDRRAKRENDKWHEGRVGIFGTIEQVFCLKRLASSPYDVTMVSYRSLFFDDPLLMAQVTERLGVDAAAFDQNKFEEKVFQRHKAKPPVRGDYYQEFFSEFRFDLIDAYFEANPLSQSSNAEFIKLVNEQFENLPRPARFAEFLRKIDPAAEDFAGTWRRQLRGIMDNREHPAAEWVLSYVNRATKHLGEPVSAGAAK